MGFFKDIEQSDELELVLMSEREMKAVEKKTVKITENPEDDIVFVDADKT